MEEVKKEQPKLQSEVSARYDLVGCKPGKHNFANFGEIDLTKVTLKDAKALVAAGFPNLVLKTKSTAADDDAAVGTKSAAK